MSHFAVLVVGDNPVEQLKPFQENNMGDCPSEYMKFFDMEEDKKEEYEKDKASRFRNPVTKEHFCKYDEQFKVQNESSSKGPLRSTSQQCPDGWEEVEIPVKEIYTYHEYLEDYCGYEKDKDNGKYGYWENPQAKWDWHSLGGRWMGYFKLKKGADGSVGHPGVFDNKAEEGWADSALKKDIDFEGMRGDAGDKAAKQYDLVLRLFGGEIPKLDFEWPTPKGLKGKDVKKIRDEYRNQPAMVLQRKLVEELEKNNSFTEEEKRNLSWFDLATYQTTKDEYIKRVEDSCIATFAILKDKQWYERGSMGWWACVSNENPEWPEFFTHLFNEISDNTLLSVYDCHI